MTTHVDEFQEEIFIVWIAVCLSPQRLDLVVDALDLPSRDAIGRMGKNSVEMRSKELSEPHQMSVPFFFSRRTFQAKIHDAVDVFHHAMFRLARKCLLQHLLDEIRHKQQPVLFEDALVPLHVPDITALDFRHGEDAAFPSEDFPLACFAVFPLQRRTAGHQDMPAALQASCSLVVSSILQAFLFVLPNLAHDLVVEVLEDVEIVEDHAEMRALLHERLLEIGVHVERDRFNVRHPFQADVLDEVIDDLLLLPL